MVSSKLPEKAATIETRKQAAAVKRANGGGILMMLDMLSEGLCELGQVVARGNKFDPEMVCEQDYMEKMK